MSRQAHAAAVKALLAAQIIRVYDGQVPASPTYPYAVMWMDGGLRDSERSTDELGRASFRIQITSVGANAEAARIVADKAATALLGVAPTVAGRVSHRIRHESSEPVQDDVAVTIPGTATHPAYAVDVYRWVTTPA